MAHPQEALKVLRVVGACLRRLVGIIEELSFTTVRHRLASLLLHLAQKEGRRSAAGVEITLSGKPLKSILYKDLDLDLPWESFNIAHELTTKGIQKFVADYRSTLRRSA